MRRSVHKMPRAFMIAGLFFAVGACSDGESTPSNGAADSGTGEAGGSSGSDAGGQADGGTDATSPCPTGGGEAPAGPCLIVPYAGTHAVTASTGTHSRGTIIIASDGSIDYDTSLQFGAADYQGVYDRLQCCKRISVEVNPRSDNDTNLAPDARHRVDVFVTDSTLGSPIVSFEYYPNWPSEQGKVVLTKN